MWLWMWTAASVAADAAEVFMGPFTPGSTRGQTLSPATQAFKERFETVSAAATRPPSCDYTKITDACTFLLAIWENGFMVGL